MRGYPDYEFVFSKEEIQYLTANSDVVMPEAELEELFNTLSRARLLVTMSP